MKITKRGIAIAGVCAAMASFAAEPKGEPAFFSSPARLTVARLPEGLAPIVADGKLTEKAWDFAASMPQLVCGNFRGKSGEIPPHAFRLAYDEKNLYLAFTTVFPGRIPYIEGVPRKADGDTEVWGSESWEFYLRFADHKFRFAANVADGTTEWCDGNAKWDGKWEYASSRAMRIDDSVLWTGEAIIPWTTLDRKGPPAADEIARINACRTWTLSTFGGISSLEFTGRGYSYNETWTKANFAPTAAYRLVKRTDPADGEYAEDFALAADRDSKVSYEVALVKLDESLPVKRQFEKTLDMKKGQVFDGSLRISTAESGYDAVRHIVTQDGTVVMCEIVPYELSKEVVRVTPFYLKEFIRLKFKKPFSGRIVLKAADGKTFYDEVSAGKDVEIPFPRRNPAGDYALTLVDGKGETVAESKLSYPGIGEWEKQDFHEDWILPSFDPLTTALEKDGFVSTMYAKAFAWKKSYLPTSFKARGEEMFAEAPAIFVDGVKAEPDAFTVTSNRPHHVGFAAKGALAESTGWLEYDGTFFNRVTVTPKGKGEIKVRYAMPAEKAKYLHASAAIFGWGAKRTEKTSTTTLGDFPTMWLGDEEKGLCFFYETRWNWTSDSKKTYSVEKKGDTVYVTVCVAETLPAGKPFTFEFGLLGTPMRKLAPNYPFDLLGESYFSPLNRPGRRPTCDVSELTADDWKRGSDLGCFFGDIPTEAGRIRDENIKFALDKYEKGRNTRPTAYTCARHLSVKYPEVAAYIPSWTFKPEVAMDYTHTGHFVYDCCPTTTANDFFMWKYRQQLKRYPELKGIYLDFGVTHACSNEDHGCREKTTILGQREFYRRLCVVQVEAGVENPVVVIHNTDFVQGPAVSFVSHFLNGEHIRQASSPILHQKKDILDTYGIEMFASELSTLPWGVSNSAYFPVDRLTEANGGDEPADLYKFRMNKATMGSCLVHNTMHALWRCHFGLFDKIVRFYDAFGVAKTAKFVGYWKKPAAVKGADDVYVSFWTDGSKLLAVIAHIGKAHEDRDVEITLDPKVLGLKGALFEAKDLMPADDPEYAELYELRKKAKLTNPLGRVPLDLGEFGTRIDGFDGKTLKYHLPYHTFGLVELK